MLRFNPMIPFNAIDARNTVFARSNLDFAAASEMPSVSRCLSSITWLILPTKWQRNVPVSLTDSQHQKLARRWSWR